MSVPLFFRKLKCCHQCLVLCIRFNFKHHIFKTKTIIIFCRSSVQEILIVMSDKDAAVDEETSLLSEELTDALELGQAPNSLEDKEVKVGKSPILRPVFLRQITRILSEKGDDDVVFVSGLATAVQETVVIFNTFGDAVVLEKIETRKVLTNRGRVAQLRLGLRRNRDRFRIPLELKPQNTTFCSRRGIPSLFSNSCEDDETRNFRGILSSSSCEENLSSELEQAGHNMKGVKELLGRAFVLAHKSPGRVVGISDDLPRGILFCSCRGGEGSGAALVVFDLKGLNSTAAVIFSEGLLFSEGLVAARKGSLMREAGKNIVVAVNQYNVKTCGRKIKSVYIPTTEECFSHAENTNPDNLGEAFMEGLFLNPSAQIDFSPAFEFACADGTLNMGWQKTYGNIFAQEEAKISHSKDGSLELWAGGEKVLSG